MHLLSAQHGVSIVHQEDVSFRIFDYVVSALSSLERNWRWSAPITLPFANLRAEQMQNSLGLRNLTNLIIRVFSWKISCCPQTVLSSKQALTTPPVLL